MHLRVFNQTVQLALASLLFVTGAAYAQELRVDVPFQFTVGKAQMPAGPYLIRRAIPIYVSAEMIRGTDQRTSGSSDFFNTTAVENKGRKNETDLVFRCYNSECFLSQIWIAGSNVGRQVPLQIPERLLAQGAPAPNDFVIVAKR